MFHYYLRYRYLEFNYFIILLDFLSCLLTTRDNPKSHTLTFPSYHDSILNY